MKDLLAHLPSTTQHTLKAWKYRQLIRHQRFISTEPEYARCRGWLRPGDCAIDVGANIGCYTQRFSDLVGPTGRVYAFEPVPETFALLTRNVHAFTHRNITLLNVAASDRTGLASMSIPFYDGSELENLYMAKIGTQGDFTVASLPLDLVCSGPVALLKIDAEGHDFTVLKGAVMILSTHHPVVMIEDRSDAVRDFLAQYGYRGERMAGSPNVVYQA